MIKQMRIPWGEHSAHSQLFIGEMVIAALSKPPGKAPPPPQASAPQASKPPGKPPGKLVGDTDNALQPPAHPRVSLVTEQKRITKKQGRCAMRSHGVAVDDL